MLSSRNFATMATWHNDFSLFYIYHESIIQYATSTFTIMHLIILHKHWFQFLLGRLSYPGELKNKGYAIFFPFLGGGGEGGGEKRCIMRNVEVAYSCWLVPLSTHPIVFQPSNKTPLTEHFVSFTICSTLVWTQTSMLLIRSWIKRGSCISQGLIFLKPYSNG